MGVAVKGLRLGFILLVLAVPVRAQQQQDQDVSLTISFANGITRFHVGEVIPIELSFRALVPDSYDIDTRDYDRSGRLDMEQLHVTPPGRDPLKNYYSFGGFLGGGLGSQETLSSQPYVMREDLNEWVAVDKPGDYSLYVTSGRVARRGATSDQAVELQSNTLEFDVVAADPAWQQGTLSWAETTLSMESSTNDQKVAALRTLRFLDTPASIRELVHFLGTAPVDSWDEVAGLAGSRYQTLVVHELQQEMIDPGVALTASYLYILSKLEFELENKTLPPFPENDAEAQKSWEEQSQSRSKEFDELQDSLYREAARLVPSKWGVARAETIRALLERSVDQTGEAEPLEDVPPEEIASAFLNLSADEQWDLLTSSWEHLKIPAMFAPLERVAAQAQMKNQMLRDLALRRLYELDPRGARPIFLEEIQHPHIDDGMFTVNASTLGVLPDKTLPQFDQMLAARLGTKDSRTMDLDAGLIGRYATKAIATQVKRVYETAPGEWDCKIEDGLVLYFLRIEPNYGVERLAAAPSACMQNSLPAVVKMNRWKEVQPGIIARLNEPDLWRAGQAAETLAMYGDSNAEKALWERLGGFHAQWAPRANELTAYRPGMAKDTNEAMAFQGALIEAIGKAQAWLVSNEQIEDLENLTFGQERDNVKQWHWSSPVDLTVSLSGDPMVATVHQYSALDLPSLLSKLAQYPAGTEFSLNISGPPDRVSKATAAINELAAEHGFQVEQPSLSY